MRLKGLKMFRKDSFKELLKKLEKLEEMGDKLRESDSFRGEEFKKYIEYWQTIRHEVADTISEFPNIFQILFNHTLTSAMLLTNTHDIPREERLKGLKLLAVVGGNLEDIARECPNEKIGNKNPEEYFRELFVKGLDECIKRKYEHEQEHGCGEQEA